MKNHVWRPLQVVIVLVALLLVFRHFYVPRDFGVQDQGYMYGFHRLGNEKDWKDIPGQLQVRQGQRVLQGLSRGQGDEPPCLAAQDDPV